ncbi:DUF1203 domain-containing protein [Streptomyces albidochromogenes]|uniref:DUF1203 domain-containing protein n=1 Tax=Streptomyces albidochromogenes TaxID=329524 RepID=A0ABW6FMQ3_9ACTN
MTSTHTPQALTSPALEELRVRDDAGRAMHPYVDEEGGAPLRCCFRLSAVGDRIALVSYAPLRRWAEEEAAEPGAYDEQGPVFIHAADCGGPESDSARFGAAGGVGHLGVHRQGPGWYVIGTARAAKHEYVRGLGADEMIDYTVEDFSALRHAVLDTVSTGRAPDAHTARVRR